MLQVLLEQLYNCVDKPRQQGVNASSIITDASLAASTAGMQIQTAHWTVLLTEIKCEA